MPKIALSLAAFATIVSVTLNPVAIGSEDSQAPVLVLRPVNLDLALPPDAAAMVLNFAPLDQTATIAPPPARPEPVVIPAAVVQPPPPAALAEALRLYASGDLAAGDRAASTLPPGIWSTTAEWAALKNLPRPSGYARIMQFLNDHPAWPSSDWLVRRAEEALYADKPAKAVVKSAFAARQPQSPVGKLALARVLAAEGDASQAASLVRDVWHKADLGTGLEKAILHEFGEHLTKADHKYRADRLLYKESVGPALRMAALAGPDVLALARARAAVINEAASDILFAAVPAALRADAGLRFSNIQKLRRAEHVEAAVDLMLKAPQDADSLVNGDEWWVERRMLARDMLDKGETEIAYRLCAQHSASGTAARIEAEFHAGWIALRFRHEPALARGHFTALARLAENPMSITRAAYWLGRTQEALGDKDGANAFYAKAGQHSSMFYGQLARARLGWSDLPMRLTSDALAGDDRAEAIRVAEILQKQGMKEVAASLMLDSAQHLDDARQMAALAQVAVANRDPRLSLMVGKAASQHGFAFDDLAFPTFGVPDFQPLTGSADRAIVYAIARQESAFAPGASSGAGAKGLMQMLVATARRTAQKAGVGFDAARLTSDPAFNAQLGAAHLGTLFEEQGGSYILTFAAYNAGGGRVRDWIKAHGDPRDPNVDVVDWIELIPITETRNYVQRIVENLQIYRSRLGQQSTLLIDADLHASGGKF